MSLQNMITTLTSGQLAEIVNRPPNIKHFAKVELERRGIRIRGNSVVLIKEPPAKLENAGRTVGCWHCGEYLGRVGNAYPGCENVFTWEKPE